MSNQHQYPDCGQKYPLADFEKINYFARKWRWKILDRYPDIGECVFSDECFEMGFGMDLGKSMQRAFPGKDVHLPTGLREIINEINDVFLLGTAIFSYWRAQTHWADWCGMAIYGDEPREWLQIAFERLIALTDSSENDFWVEEEFWGKSDLEKRTCHFVKQNDGHIVDAHQLKEQVRVAGSFRIYNIQEIMQTLKVGQMVLLVRDRENEFDKNAIRVKTYVGGIKLGYIPRKLAAVLSLEIDRGFIHTGYITELNMKEQKIYIGISRRLKMSLDNILGLEITEIDSKASTEIKTRINFLKKKIVRSERSSFGTRISEINFSDEFWEHFCYPELGRCNFLCWAHDKYISDSGDFKWQMKVRYGPWTVKKIIGGYPLPIEWDFFQDCIQRCLKLKNGEHL